MIKSNKKGFTIIELIVVIAIIGFIAGIVIASLKSVREKSNNTVRNDNMLQLNNAVSLYLTMNNDRYPSTGGIWKCAGLPEGSGTCFAGAFTGSTSLNTELATVLGAIPKDPSSGFMSSDYYIYNSLTPTSYSTLASYTSGGGHGFGSSPAGAHFSWFVLNLGQTSPCGPGYPYAFTGGTTQIQCMLYLGPGNL